MLGAVIDRLPPALPGRSGKCNLPQLRRGVKTFPIFQAARTCVLARGGFYPEPSAPSTLFFNLLSKARRFQRRVVSTRNLPFRQPLFQISFQSPAFRFPVGGGAIYPEPSAPSTPFSLFFQLPAAAVFRAAEGVSTWTVRPRQPLFSSSFKFPPTRLPVRRRGFLHGASAPVNPLESFFFQPRAHRAALAVVDAEGVYDRTTRSRQRLSAQSRNLHRNTPP